MCYKMVIWTINIIQPWLQCGPTQSCNLMCMIVLRARILSCPVLAQWMGLTPRWWWILYCAICIYLLHKIWRCALDDRMFERMCIQHDVILWRACMILASFGTSWWHARPFGEPSVPRCVPKPGRHMGKTSDWGCNGSCMHILDLLKQMINRIPHLRSSIILIA